jgi:hypothetical protein
MRDIRRIGIAVTLVAVMFAAVSASAWWAQGHRRATRTALQALGDRLPAFFSQGSAAVAQSVSDPDMLRHSGGPELASTEGPEHYFDIELLDLKQVPQSRRQFLKMCQDKGLAPAKTGTLPYAIIEWTSRLAVAFAEHRRWPDDEHIRAKCLLYAGFVAHYAQDLCQPLHTTIHFDGRAKPDGSSPGSGIHERLDDLLGRVEFDVNETAAGIEPRVLEPLLPALLKRIQHSNSLVERVYELEQQLPSSAKSWQPSAAVSDLAKDRLAACAQLTSDLYLTAWQRSAAIKLPSWLKRTESPQP